MSRRGSVVPTRGEAIGFRERARERRPPQLGDVVPLWPGDGSPCPKCEWGRMWSRSPEHARCSYQGCGHEVQIPPEEWVYWLDGRPVRWTVLRAVLVSVQESPAEEPR